jgi:hypothetical protein
MRLFTAILVSIALLAASAQASVLLSENWESGTDGWTDVGSGPYAALSTAQNTTVGGAYSLKTADTTTGSTNAKDYSFATESAKNWYLKFNFMETGSTREYIQLYSYAGTSLQQLIAFGTYNTVDYTKYNFRVTNGSVGWSNTTVARKNNVWHAMYIEQDLAGNLTFKIDGNVAATPTTTSIFGVTKIRVGSALGNGSHGAYYDDIEFGVVPEPATLAFLLAGFGLISRRRRA